MTGKGFCRRGAKARNLPYLGNECVVQFNLGADYVQTGLRSRKRVVNIFQVRGPFAAMAPAYVGQKRFVPVKNVGRVE